MKLGLLTKTGSVTRMGETCLAGDMDICSTLLAEVGRKLDVETYARVASAFIACGVDLFSMPHPGVRQPIGLSEEQLRLASKLGDVHTAVIWFLKWFPKKSLPADLAHCFNILCFWKMLVELGDYLEDLVLAAETKDWGLRLSVALGFAYQKNIVCQHGNRCVTCHIEEDERRTPLHMLNAEVKISEWSVCYYDEERDSSSWLVYTKTARFPNIKGLTVLPANIAAWFAHFRFRQEKDFDFAMAFRCLLNDPQRCTTLSEFVSVLAKCDATAEAVTQLMPDQLSREEAEAEGAPRVTPGSATDKSDAMVKGDATDVGGVTNSNLGATASTEAMRVSSTEQQRAALPDAAAPEAPRPACPHELLRRVHYIFMGNFDVDTNELVQVLRGIGTVAPELRDVTNSMVEDVMRAEAPIHGDTTRKDLVAILMMIVRNRTEMTQLHRKVKAFVYGLHVKVLKDLSDVIRRRPGEAITLSLAEQEDLLRRALAGQNPEVLDENDCESAKQLIDRLLLRIDETNVARGRNQQVADAARKKLRSARQMIDMQHTTIVFVVHDDVVDMVTSRGVTDRAQARKMAQKIWTETCFTLEIMRTPQGDEGTRAEFMQRWLRSGHAWDVSFEYLKTLFPSRRKRSLSPRFRENVIKRSRENAERARAEAGGGTS